MAYNRVIPRDLFNEANLLKCYGQIYLNLEKLNLPHVTFEHDGDEFNIIQNEDDGSLTIGNIELRVNGKIWRLHRPLNSRYSWPLYAMVGDLEVEVFDDGGQFSHEMLMLLAKG